MATARACSGGIFPAVMTNLQREPSLVFLGEPSPASCPDHSGKRFHNSESDCRLLFLPNRFPHGLFDLGIQFIDLALGVIRHFIAFGKNDLDARKPPGQSPFTAQLIPGQEKIVAQGLPRKPEQDVQQLARFVRQRMISICRVDFAFLMIMSAFMGVLPFCRPTLRPPWFQARANPGYAPDRTW